ncbi:MAG: DinB family protein, partial [Proteobacteria bacterium]|nr:DinB family protein [Pseudomonadota bacterium]
MTPFAHSEADPLAALYGRVRGLSLGLAAPLSDADATVQSMDDASPAKWHLAHTSWFFETFVLRGVSGYRAFDPAYAYLFNSYYEAEGPRHARPRRGMLTRPSLDEICAYRAYVDAALADALPRLGEEARGLVELGCHHEQQHQELLLTDLLHLFSQNPLKPAVGYRQPLSLVPSPSTPPAGVARDKLQPLAEVEGRGSELVTRPSTALGTSGGWWEFVGGVARIGHFGGGFAFDCEGPRHETLLQPYALAERPVTNGEWIAFFADGGYRDPRFWLSDGWAWVQRE